MTYLTLHKQIKDYLVNLIYNEVINEGDTVEDVIKKLKDPHLLIPIIEKMDTDEWFDTFGKSYEDEQYAFVELVKSRVIESLRDYIAEQHHEAMCEYHDNKQLAHDPHGYYGVSPSDFI